jgi:hypothetical protein
VVRRMDHVARTGRHARACHEKPSLPPVRSPKVPALGSDP